MKVTLILAGEQPGQIEKISACGTDGRLLIDKDQGVRGWLSILSEVLAERHRWELSRVGDQHVYWS